MLIRFSYSVSSTVITCAIAYIYWGPHGMNSIFRSVLRILLLSSSHPWIFDSKCVDVALFQHFPIQFLRFKKGESSSRGTFTTDSNLSCIESSASCLCFTAPILVYTYPTYKAEKQSKKRKPLSRRHRYLTGFLYPSSLTCLFLNGDATIS